VSNATVHADGGAEVIGSLARLRLRPF